MNFKAMPISTILKTNLRETGHLEPTPVQQQAIPSILQGRDLLGLAQTGTGKTAAFLVPILHRLTSGPRKRIRALIVSPTRELAEQTNRYATTLAKQTGLRSVAVYGGVSKQQQAAKIAAGVELVVACPGRLLDLVNSGLIDLSGVEVVVLDEADHLFDQGFFPDIRKILAVLPGRRQNLLFSATMGAEIRSLAEAVLTDPVRVQVDHQRTLETISHLFFRVAQQHKLTLLKEVLEQRQVASAVVFTRTKHKAKKLARQLSRTGCQAVSLEGNMSQNSRRAALDGFKSGRYSILVATDIAARGIDISALSHVINFDMPQSQETYTHRTGRTGRAGNAGTALTFVTPEDAPMIARLQRSLGGNCRFDGEERFASPPSPEAVGPERPAKLVKPVKNRLRSRGKRSSQRNRAAAFDFGLR